MGGDPFLGKVVYIFPLDSGPELSAGYFVRAERRFGCSLFR